MVAVLENNDKTNALASLAFVLLVAGMSNQIAKASDTPSSEGKAVELADSKYSANPEVQQVMDIAGDVEYGEYLAGECLTCHQSSDNSGRVPPIHNLSPDYFINALLEYQSGTRSNSVMQSISSALGAEEIAALSAVFSQQAEDN